jgi:hypothetical protein
MMIGDQHTGSGIVTVPMDWSHFDGAASYSKMPRGGKGGGVRRVDPRPRRARPPEGAAAAAVPDPAATLESRPGGRGGRAHPRQGGRPARDRGAARRDRGRDRLAETDPEDEAQHKSRITYEDLLTGAETDLASVNTAVADDAAAPASA